MIINLQYQIIKRTYFVQNLIQGLNLTALLQQKGKIFIFPVLTFLVQKLFFDIIFIPTFAFLLNFT